MAARPFFVASLASLALAALLGLLPATPLAGILDDHALPQAHMVLAVFGAVVPGLTGLHLLTLQRLLGRAVDAQRAKVVALAWALGAATLALVLAFLDGWVRLAGLALALVCLAEAAILGVQLVLRNLPRRGQSVVDVARDPLTKGDDAVLKQVRLAHFLLVPATVATVATGPWWEWSGTWTRQAWLAGLHLLLAGHGLLSTYALTHAWIPRLSRVPAIAAGAIKGELHASMLGLLLLTLGFALDVRALTIAGGAFVFFAAFTWMGVLGANIMRNKSRTQRVTPEFTYVPWVFTGVFWIVCGILLGVFLNAVPATFADRFPALRFTHTHAILLGGLVQTALGCAMRLVPEARGLAPVPFHRAKWGFYALNSGLALLVAAHLRLAATGTMALAGGLLVLAGLAAAFMSLRPNRPRPAGTAVPER